MMVMLFLAERPLKRRCDAKEYKGAVFRIFADQGVILMRDFVIHRRDRA